MAALDWTNDGAPSALLEGGRRWIWSFTGTCGTDDVLKVTLPNLTSGALLSVFVRAAAPATEVNPELHSAATPTAATLVKALSWGTSTAGLVYEAGDGPVRVRLTSDGEVWLRPKPDASCTLTAQIVWEAP